MNGQYMYVVDMDGNIIIGTRGGQRMHLVSCHKIIFQKIFKVICYMETEEDGYGLYRYMGIISVFSRD